jgi:hypothetical protein
MVALASSKEEVIEYLKNDIYAKSEVWDFSKVRLLLPLPRPYPDKLRLKQPWQQHILPLLVGREMQPLTYVLLDPNLPIQVCFQTPMRLIRSKRLGSQFKDVIPEVDEGK